VKLRNRELEENTQSGISLFVLLTQYCLGEQIQDHTYRHTLL